MKKIFLLCTISIFTVLALDSCKKATYTCICQAGPNDMDYTQTTKSDLSKSESDTFMSDCKKNAFVFSNTCIEE